MHNGMDNDALFQLQWSSLQIVESDRLKLSDKTPTVHSFKDLDPANIYFYGEFAYYVKYIEKKTDENALTQEQTVAYFTLSPTFGNFMNPANLQDFFDKYSENNYGAILKRFGLTQNAHVDSLMGYFKYVIKSGIEFTDLGGTYDQNAYARLLLKTMKNTYQILQF